MDTTTSQLLSSALQDLARGLKKLRCVVDRQCAVPKSPQIPVSGDKKSPSEMKSELLLPISEIKQENEIAVSQNGTKIPETGESYEIRGHEPKDWLFHEDNPWNSFHATCTFLFNKTLRGDRFKNQWEEDKTCLKGWKKISAEHLHEYYIDAYRYHDDCATMVEFAPNKWDLESDRGTNIPDEKWERRRCLWEGDTSERVFRKWLVSVHSSLPALNLPSVK